MIKKFLNRSVQYANKFLFTKDDASTFTATIEAQPGTISETGTPLSADNFNEVQKNCVFSLVATHRIESENSIYTVDLSGITEFGVFEGLKLLVYMPTSNTGLSKIELKDDSTLVSTVEIKKKNSDGLNVSLDSLDILKGAYVTLKYESGLWVLTNQANAMNVKQGNIIIHNSENDLPTMQDNSSDYLDERQDSVTGKMYICTNKDGSAAVANPTSDFEEISVWQNAKQLETLSKENFNRTVLFSGSHSTTGILTLNDNWDEYNKILIVALSSVYGDANQTILYTSELETSDGTTADTSSENTLYMVENVGYMSGIFRDTNRNELYITALTGNIYIKKIIGIGKL